MEILTVGQTDGWTPTTPFRTRAGGIQKHFCGSVFSDFNNKATSKSKSQGHHDVMSDEWSGFFRCVLLYTFFKVVFVFKHVECKFSYVTRRFPIHSNVSIDPIIATKYVTFGKENLPHHNVLLQVA